MKKAISSIVAALPVIGPSFRRYREFNKNSCYPAGHYYSPVISVDEVRSREAQIWQDPLPASVPGVRLETEAQLALLEQLAVYYSELPFQPEKSSTRYHYRNEFYSYTDGIILYSMMRHFKPKRIIEIGSGFSSSVMMDVNDRFFGNSLNLTFVEPYPQRLHSLMSEQDRKTFRVLEQPIQAVPTAEFERLERGDILFVDSTHVSKTGSDVNHILFELLPVLQSGVLVHFHDIFYPFEYPKDWVYQGRGWNETYMLRAFLSYNDTFAIRLFSHYLHVMHGDAFKKMPLCRENFGGNIWLQKH